MKVLTLVLAFFKKEWEWLKSAWQSAGDEVSLYWRDQEIKNLNDELDGAVGWERRQLLKDLEGVSKNREEIIARIKERDARCEVQHKQPAVTH